MCSWSKGLAGENINDGPTLHREETRGEMKVSLSLFEKIAGAVREVVKSANSQNTKTREGKQ